MPELGRLAAQPIVVEGLDLVLERVDDGNHGLEGLELLALARGEEFLEDAHRWPIIPLRDR
ncbi:MAG: hypothetical protein ACRDJ5_05305 [Actinomycetota bacterium]